MNERLRKLLGVEPSEFGPVVLLLSISFLMGLFLATVLVASQTQFLNFYDEGKDLPVALVISGTFGLIATLIYNFFQGRISFNVLATFSLVVIILITAFLEFGEGYVHNYFQDPNFIYFIAFTQILPFIFISKLIFWGAFGRLFNLRQAKRIIGSVDIGVDIASIIAFFSIPVLLGLGVPIESLYTIALVSITGYLVLFLVLSKLYLNKSRMEKSDVGDESRLKKLGLISFFRSRYIVSLSLFVIVSITALRFVDYSFFNVATQRFNAKDLPIFLSSFEATIVIFGILFSTFAADRITQDYGLRVSLVINPILLILFTLAALTLGFTFGYEGGESMIFFFIMIAMSKLFVNSLKEALDDPVYKMYYIPIDKSIKLDAQTKIEGVITAFASIVAGGLIVLINQFEIFNLLSITLFTLPILLLWYLVINRMYHGYRDTLQNSLLKSRKVVEDRAKKEYTMHRVLENEVLSDAEDKVVYGLKLMEKLEPALFESSLLRLSESNLKRVRQFALNKISELGIGQETGEMKGLALQAAGDSEASDLLSISGEKLMKLSKSVKQADRMLAAKLLRKLINQKTIFILLELLRDPDPRVRTEALLTARRLKRPETWPILLELISSPAYSHQAIAALKEAGEPVLQVLEAAFHKSGQSDMVMLKIIQIMGHIGGTEGLGLLWKKADYPDKRIVKQIVYSLRYINYQAKGREAILVKDLLDTEMSKTMWNLAALDELPDKPHFAYLRQAIAEEVRENYDQITLLLSLLYDPKSVQLVRENILAATPDSIQYALELLDLFIDKDLKPKLIPLLDDTKTSDKLEKIQVYFPRETYDAVQVINYILNRDFNYNNRWSKVCAVHAAAYLSEFRVSRGLISQVFNQDKLLQETAAWVIYNKDKSVYQAITERIPHKDKRFLDTSIENNQLLDGLDDGFFLAIEMVLFLNQLAPFRGIPGNLLCDLTDKIHPIDLDAKDKIVFAPAEDMPILIVAHGEIILKNGEEEVSRLKKGAVFGDLFQEGAVPSVSEAIATVRSIVFRISLHDFYFVLAKHHDLVQGIIRNVTGKKETVS